MNTDRIVQTWSQASKFPGLPEYLREIISINFDKNVNFLEIENLESYLRDKIEQFKPILSAPPFTFSGDVYDISLWTTEEHVRMLRNLAFVFWLCEGEAGDLSESPDFNHWREEAFVSGLYSLYLAKSLFVNSSDDIFILTFLKDISLLGLAKSFPKIHREILKMPAVKRMDAREVFRIVGIHPGELSAWVLTHWGFPEEFSRPLLQNQLSSQPEKTDKIIYFSKFVADFTLNQESNIKFTDLERLFKQLFNRGTHELLELLVEVIRILPKQGAFFGFQRLADITIIEILKDHINLFDKDLLTYHDLLNETVKAHKKILAQSTQIQLLQRQLEKNFIKDTITGLHNHIYFREFLNQKIREAMRYEYPLTLILFDLDNFHQFNKEYGYEVGNALLLQLAKIVRVNIRQSDILARIGNDEFALVLPYTGIPQSRVVAEKILHLIRDSSFSDVRNSRMHKMTISVGYASVLPDGSQIRDDSLIALVTRAMNESKDTGGNSVTQASA